MDRYMKGFVIAALIYLGLASVGGILIGAGMDQSWLRFLHVHFNLLGFMSMMVFGIGYFILPRFNGKEIRFPGLLPVHFYAANIGLIGMVAAYPQRPSLIFDAFAVLQGVSVGLFIFNLVATLAIEPKAVKRDDEGAAEPILPGMRVGELLERYPGIHEVFVDNGIAALADPRHREQVLEMPVTVTMAANKHGIPLEKLIVELNRYVGVRMDPVGGRRAPFENERAGLTRGDRIEAEHILGEIIDIYPEAESVFRELYGDGCFSCPGQATESVKMSALMHSVSEREVLEKLNGVVGAVSRAKDAGRS